MKVHTELDVCLFRHKIGFAFLLSVTCLFTEVLGKSSRRAIPYSRMAVSSFLPSEIEHWMRRGLAPRLNKPYKLSEKCAQFLRAPVHVTPFADVTLQHCRPLQITVQSAPKV